MTEIKLDNDKTYLVNAPIEIVVNHVESTLDHENIFIVIETNVGKIAVHGMRIVEMCEVPD